jgi:uncharacterized protein YjbI with pentapeptide repeats
MTTNTLSFSSEIKSKLYGKDFYDASTYEIIEEVKKWGTLQLNVFWENLRTLKKELTLNEQELNFSNFVFPNFERTEKTSNFWTEDENFTFNKEVNFSEAYFMGEVDFSNVTFKENVNFSKAKFKDDVKFYYSTIEKEISFEKVQFKEETNFYHSNFLDKTSFDEATFHAKTVFHQVNFEKKASFSLLSSKYRITFFDCMAKKISFKYSRIENAYFINNNFEYFNLHGVAIQTPYFSDNDIKEAERETFAYMKNFFDKRNDYISANYYYAKEMRAYQKKLFPKTKVNFFKKILHWFNKPNLGDKLVFGFSKLASNFGQNIFLPIYWILFVGALFVGLKGKHNIEFIVFSIALLAILSSLSYLFLKIFKREKREDIVWLLAQATLSFVSVGIFLYHGTFIADFAKVINPLQLLKDSRNFCQGIELSCFMTKVFIATMVYHFVIASKRGVKR